MKLDDRVLVGILEAAPDAMVCVAADGRMVLVNAQTERTFGFPREQLVGQSVELLVPEADRAVHRRYRTRYVTHPSTRPMGIGMRLTGRRSDGTTFPAEISLSTADTSDGRLTIAAVRDLSERIEAEAEAERLRSQVERDKLERQGHQSQRLESLGQLAGGVAHDFNNLLGAISNYAAFVAEEVAKEAPEVQLQSVRADVEQIQRTVERAATLTHRLLAFARREVIQPTVLNLNDVIADLEQLLVRTLGEHITFATAPAADLCAVLADRGQIEQVLVNLALNARDAMPSGGRLTIQTANAEVDEASMASQVGLKPGRYVSVKVSDTGEGMPKPVMERAFEPFFTTKPEGEGSGLGLATVYGIISQAGGTVRIYSEPGLGTTVNMLLPVTERVARVKERPSQELEGGGGELVLVVEDEPTMREVTRRILDRHGYRVLVARGGAEALDMLAAQPGPIDVLLTDVVMPQMMGPDLAERVRALQPGVRVMFMSGYTQGVFGDQGILESGVNLLEKPFSESSLLGKLHEVLAAPPR
ncbi:MAG TPA: ATP-binding protein [Streptosporangiaceae bacterium]